MKTLFLKVSLVLLVTAGLAGCGKNNIFSWAHNSGGSTDVRSLEADAYAALQNKDYAKAAEYYSKILNSDSSNSDAIYGYSSAKLADAGLDIGSLVSNFIRQQDTPTSLAPALSFMAQNRASTSASNLLPDSIAAKISTIRPVIDDVITRLEKIVKGQADGKIAPDNPDVNLNLGFCYILRAAILVQNSGISFDTDYKVLITAQNVELATSVGKDIVRALFRFAKVIDKLNFASDSAVANVKSDIHSMFAELKSEAGIDVDETIDYLMESL